jgi:hypothetical protein
VTLEGTVAAVTALDESEIEVPPLGAALVSVTVPVTEFASLALCGVTAAFVSDTALSVGATIVSDCVMGDPVAATAEIVAVALAATGVVATVNDSVDCPAGTVTDVALGVADAMVLEIVTCRPPAGAGPLSVIVPADEAPPATLAGDNVIAATDGATLSAMTSVALLGEPAATDALLEMVSVMVSAPSATLSARTTIGTVAVLLPAAKTACDGMRL